MNNDGVINDALIKEIPVTSYMIDLRGNLSIHSLFSLFQEMAWEHASKAGFGFSHLQEQGLFWVISRVYVEIIQIPQWTDTIRLTTWPSGTEGVFALRDFLVHAEDGRRIVNATSSWLIVDVETRRPKRPSTIGRPIPEYHPQRALGFNAHKIVSTPINLFTSIQTVSQLSDIDINGHINNTKYLEWALNSLPADFYAENIIKGLSVNFLNEGFLDDKYSINTFKLNESHLFTEIMRERDGQKMCTIEFHTAKG